MLSQLDRQISIIFYPHEHLPTTFKSCGWFPNQTQQSKDQKFEPKLGFDFQNSHPIKEFEGFDFYPQEHLPNMAIYFKNLTVGYHLFIFLTCMSNVVQIRC